MNERRDEHMNDGRKDERTNRRMKDDYDCGTPSPYQCTQLCHSLKIVQDFDQTLQRSLRHSSSVIVRCSCLIVHVRHANQLVAFIIRNVALRVQQFPASPVAVVTTLS